MIIIHATFHIDPVKEDQFLQEARPLIEGSRAESGCVFYRLQKDVEQENMYTMVEVWQDSQAVASHNASEHFTTFVAKAEECLTAPLEAKVFEGQPLNL